MLRHKKSEHANIKYPKNKATKELSEIVKVKRKISSITQNLKYLIFNHINLHHT